MRKYIIGMILGVSLATAGSVYGAEITTLIGKPIEGEIPVKVAGVTIEKKAIFVDGTSYLPVRAIGDAIGMDVKYDAELGVELTPKEVNKVESLSDATTTTMSADDVEVLSSSEEQIVISEKKIIELTAKIESQENELNEKQLELGNTTEPTQKQWVESQVAAIKASIEVTNQLLQANKDNIVAQQKLITKIKAKYE